MTRRSIAASTVPASAQGQGRGLSLTPTVGVFIPTTELITAATGDGAFKQEVSITVGGRLGIGFSERLGLEIAGIYAPSDLKFSASSGQSTEDANVLTGSGRLTYLIVPYTSPVALALTGGVGVVRRSGTAYEGLDDKTDVGGTVGASLRFRLGSLLRLQINAEDYIYKATIIDGAEEKTQHDVHLSFGVGIPFLGLGSQGR
jgi:hypothetical protein